MTQQTEVSGIEVFGPQMFLEGGGCDYGLLVDPGHVLAFLDFMPGKIGMTPITPPFVSHTRLGIQGIRLIAESHIYIKTVLAELGFYLDVFSCKMFNTEKTKLLALAHFRARTHRIRMLDRGKEFPRGMQPQRIMAALEAGRIKEQTQKEVL